MAPYMAEMLDENRNKAAIAGESRILRQMKTFLLARVYLRSCAPCV